MSDSTLLNLNIVPAVHLEEYQRIYEAADARLAGLFNDLNTFFWTPDIAVSLKNAPDRETWMRRMEHHLSEGDLQIDMDRYFGLFMKSDTLSTASNVIDAVTYAPEKLSGFLGGLYDLYQSDKFVSMTEAERGAIAKQYALSILEERHGIETGIPRAPQGVLAQLWDTLTYYIPFLQDIADYASAYSKTLFGSEHSVEELVGFSHLQAENIVAGQDVANFISQEHPGLSAGAANTIARALTGQNEFDEFVEAPASMSQKDHGGAIIRANYDQQPAMTTGLAAMIPESATGKALVAGGLTYGAYATYQTSRGFVEGVTSAGPGRAFRAAGNAVSNYRLKSSDAYYLIARSDPAGARNLLRRSTTELVESGSRYRNTGRFLGKAAGRIFVPVGAYMAVDTFFAQRAMAEEALQNGDITQAQFSAVVHMLQLQAVGDSLGPLGAAVTEGSLAALKEMQPEQVRRLVPTLADALIEIGYSDQDDPLTIALQNIESRRNFEIELEGRIEDYRRAIGRTGTHQFDGDEIDRVIAARLEHSRLAGATGVNPYDGHPVILALKQAYDAMPDEVVHDRPLWLSDLRYTKPATFLDYLHMAQQNPGALGEYAPDTLALTGAFTYDAGQYVKEGELLWDLVSEGPIYHSLFEQSIRNGQTYAQFKDDMGKTIQELAQHYQSGMPEDIDRQLRHLAYIHPARFGGLDSPLVATPLEATLNRFEVAYGKNEASTGQVIEMQLAFRQAMIRHVNAIEAFEQQHIGVVFQQDGQVAYAADNHQYTVAQIKAAMESDPLFKAWLDANPDAKNKLIADIQQAASVYDDREENEILVSSDKVTAYLQHLRRSPELIEALEARVATNLEAILAHDELLEGVVDNLAMVGHAMEMASVLPSLEELDPQSCLALDPEVKRLLEQARFVRETYSNIPQLAAGLTISDEERAYYHSLSLFVQSLKNMHNTGLVRDTAVNPTKYETCDVTASVTLLPEAVIAMLEGTTLAGVAMAPVATESKGFAPQMAAIANAVGAEQQVSMVVS
jgi:hypothetical protein